MLCSGYEQTWSIDGWRSQTVKEWSFFQKVIEEVRERQKDVFANSDAHEVERREDAHAVLRALKEIEVNLDAIITAETLLELRRK